MMPARARTHAHAHTHARTYARAYITACPTTAAMREPTTRCHHFFAPLVTLVDMPAALNLRPPTVAGVVLKIMASLVLLGEFNYLSKRQFLPRTTIKNDAPPISKLLRISLNMSPMLFNGYIFTSCAIFSAQTVRQALVFLSIKMR